MGRPLKAPQTGPAACVAPARPTCRSRRPLAKAAQGTCASSSSSARLTRRGVKRSGRRPSTLVPGEPRGPRPWSPESRGARRLFRRRPSVNRATGAAGCAVKLASPGSRVRIGRRFQGEGKSPPRGSPGPGSRAPRLSGTRVEGRRARVCVRLLLPSAREGTFHRTFQICRDIFFFILCLFFIVSLFTSIYAFWTRTQIRHKNLRRTF